MKNFNHINIHEININNLMLVSISFLEISNSTLACEITSIETSTHKCLRVFQTVFLSRSRKQTFLILKGYLRNTFLLEVLNAINGWQLHVKLNNTYLLYNIAISFKYLPQRSEEICSGTQTRSQDGRLESSHALQLFCNLEIQQPHKQPLSEETE